MSNNNLKFNLIDNVSGTLNQITNNIKNTTKIVNELNTSLGNLQFNVPNVGAFKIEINQVNQSIMEVNKSSEGFWETFSKYIGRLADWITLLASTSEALGNLSKYYKIVKKTMSDIATSSTEALKKGFTSLKGKLQEVLAPIGTFIRRVALSGLTALRAGARMAGAALRSIGIFVANIITATTAQTGFNVAVAANPLGALILGIMAVVGGIILVVKHWDFVKEKIAQFIAWVIENSPFGFIINLIDNIFPGFKDALGGLFDWVVGTFAKIADFIKGIWTSIKSWFGFGDGEEATITVKPDANGNYTGDATDAYGDPLELGAVAGSNAGQDILAPTDRKNISRSVTDYITSPEAISRPQSATPQTISQPSQAADASQGKSVSVRIENLVKNLNLNVTNMQEGSAKIRDEVNRALIAAIRDTEIAVG